MRVARLTYMSLICFLKILHDNDNLCEVSFNPLKLTNKHTGSGNVEGAAGLVESRRERDNKTGNTFVDVVVVFHEVKSVWNGYCSEKDNVLKRLASRCCGNPLVIQYFRPI